MRKNMIISGSTDRTLKIWNADSGKLSYRNWLLQYCPFIAALHLHVLLYERRSLLTNDGKFRQKTRFILITPFLLQMAQ